MNLSPQTTALLIVDVQEAAVERGPYRWEEVLANISGLIAAFRDVGRPVIYVQHDDPPGELFAPNSPGWPIHQGIAPRPDETVVRKQFNSAFRGTDLASRLHKMGIETIVLTGLQTEYCIDTTCRVAFELGFELVMPSLTNSTFDNGPLTAEQIHDLHNERIFADRFALVCPVEDVVRAIGRENA